LLTIIESPFAGDVEENIKYARACLRHSLLRGEYPFASHLLYTQEGVLNDSIMHERRLGILTGHGFYYKATICAVYTDRGISKGMKAGISFAKVLGVKIEYRSLEEKCQTK
jgi:hypothetical protein